MPHVWVSTRPVIRTPWLDTAEQEAHITLAFLDHKTEEDFDDVTDILRFVFDAGNPESLEFPFSASVRGFAGWKANNFYYRVALVNSHRHQLHRVHQKIDTRLADFGLSVNKDYAFLPHITLDVQEFPVITIPELIEPYEFQITNLFVEYGDRRAQVV